ncbi:MAG: hypothetical protein RIG62_12265 [Cyclobacteriaceae bacterium]
MICFPPSLSKPLRLAVVVCFVPICLFGGNQHIFHLTNGLSSAEVPFTLVENLIIVQAVIASKKPLNFILDNGTGNPVIFKHEHIEDLALPLGSRVTFRGVGAGQSVNATVIQGTSLHLSGVATDRLGMVVLDQNPFQYLNFGDLEVHGVLGATLFRSFVVEIDYPARMLRFHQHNNFQPPPSFQSYPMKVVDSKPYLPAIVQGKKASQKGFLMLDLGFNNALMLQMTDSLARKMLTQRIVSQVGMGYSGAVSGRLGRIASVQIGNRQVTQVSTIAPFHRSYPIIYLSSEMPRLGSVGNAFF